MDTLKLDFRGWPQNHEIRNKFVCEINLPTYVILQKQSFIRPELTAKIGCHFL